VPAATRKYVRRIMPKTEMKVAWAHHNEIQLNTLSQGYQSVNGTYINQGTQTNTRVGNQIFAQGVHLKGVFNNNSTSESFVRMIVIGYPGTNGDPLLNLFKANTTGGTQGVSTLYGLDPIYFPINTGELHVYTDKVIRLAGSATGNAGMNCKFFNQFIKLGGRKVEYKGNVYGTGLQSWMYSVIWIAADANDDTSSGTAIELSCLERFYFKDP